MKLDRETLTQQMTDYVINVLEEERPEFSGFAVCPFVKADRVSDQLFLHIFDNTKETLLDVVLAFVRSGKRSALIGQPNEDILVSETRGYQDFINLVLEESGNGNITALCFSPKTTKNIDGYSPYAEAPFFMINLAYNKDLTKARKSLLKTKYYDNLPPDYKKYLNVK